MKKNNVFKGEFGEIAEPYVSMVADNGKFPHAVVGIQLDGVEEFLDGFSVMFLSSSEAKRFAERIIRLADKANERNYSMLVNGAPF